MLEDAHPAIDWPLRPCAACGHLGFSHDNAADCAECECGQFQAEREERRTDVPAELAGADEPEPERLPELEEEAES